ncbi:MAG: TfoX/Sxy family protein [Chitinophagaceae bacterium]|nr:TfoX/Sxy family protein [Chitinophagaceae bacterium]
MAYDIKPADRIRAYLSNISGLEIEEKKMFSGLAFMVNGKMCINVSGDNLMCRVDPELQEEIAEKRGYEPMIMKGKALAGYCYVNPNGFKTKKEFEYWIKLCLDFNHRAVSSKKAKTKKN